MLFTECLLRHHRIQNKNDYEIKNTYLPSQIVFEEITLLETRNTIYEPKINKTLGRDDLKSENMELISNYILNPDLHHELMCGRTCVPQ